MKISEYVSKIKTDQNPKRKILKIILVTRNFTQIKTTLYQQESIPKIIFPLSLGFLEVLLNS